MKEQMTGALAFLAVCVILWAGVHAAGWLLICGAEYLGREIRAPFAPHEMIVRSTVVEGEKVCRRVATGFLITGFLIP